MARRRNTKPSKAEQRKLEMEMRKQRNTKVARAVVGVVVLVAIAAVVALVLKNGGNGPTAGEDITPTGSDQVTIPVAELSTSAKFYSIDSGGTKVNFFALRGSDGQIHVAIDACDVCYGDKKGYRQDGNDMVCNNCGKRYPVTSIGTENQQGGCWPSYIPFSVNGDNVVIATKDISKKAFMFK